jgi:hypothetical protein
MKYAVDAQQLRSRPDKLQPTAPGEHVWIAAAAFVITAESLANREQVHMDNENLASIDIGCYMCEQPYSPVTARRKCKPV